MLPLKEKDRVRVLSAVARKGAPYRILRICVITFSQLILLSIPLLGIVRVDLWRGHHLLLGERVGFFTALKGFILTMAMLYGVTFLSNMIVGRFFCGWGCPVGYVSRLGEAVDRSRRDTRRKILNHLLGAAFVATFVGGIMLWWVDPLVMIEGSWTARIITASIFLVLWTGGFLHAFVWRFLFCLKACPIGVYYRYVTSEAPISIKFDEHPNPCIQCGACEKVCPVDLDPKRLGETIEGSVDRDEALERYGDAECIRCGDCVEACRIVFLKRPGERPPLRFGRRGKASGGDETAVEPTPLPSPSLVEIRGDDSEGT